MVTQTLKRMLLGQPIETERDHEERLIKFLALPVFSSDAISSTAYATEEILLVLVLAGAGAIYLSLPIAMAIVGLLAILVASYRQVIAAYPSGGGAYVVARDNLGYKFGLVAGASLLIDYVLTVAVSIASGVAAITSAIPVLHEHRVFLGVVFVLLIMLANLRGVRESGKIFAIPAYSFILGVGLMLIVGFAHYFSGHPNIAPVNIKTTAFEPITMFLILRAFSSGCAALTGVEAISNGVQAFKKPEARNARITLVWMAIILGSIFLGVTELARFYHIVPIQNETVLSQLGRSIFGRGIVYYYIQAVTALLLVVAANTSFTGFPRVSSLMARDGFMPRQLMNRGNKLAFSNGILMLAFFSIVLLVIFGGDTHRLIPLYAVGVFTSFTLSQMGMVKHWYMDRGQGWMVKALINGAGAAATLIVLVVIGASKFTHGAWIVIVIVPVLILLFTRIKAHYNSIAEQLSLCNLRPPKPANNWVIMCIGGVHCGTLQALRYAKMISNNGDVSVIYVNTQSGEPTDVLQKWEKYGFSTPIEVIKSPYRDVIGPIINRVRQIHDEHPDDFITIVVPEFVCKKWWQHLLHNQTAFILKTRLMFWPNVIITSVPYQLS
ncbi:MAG: APC family permease [Firmicutes bacterium]|nr:APC family permease [Bacillota bacterium]